MSSIAGKLILIVDDVPEICLIVRRILEADGAEVIEVDRIDRAIDVAQMRIPHLIITDLHLPQKDGFEFLAFLKASPILKDVPAMVLSGLNDQNSVVKAISLGAKDYIVKPIRASLLLQKVRKALVVKSFHRVYFPLDRRPIATLLTKVDIVKISEMGVQIETAIKLAPEANVKLQAELLEQLGCSKLITRTTKEDGKFLQKGRFLHEVNFVGIGEVLAKTIRNYLRTKS